VSSFVHTCLLFRACQIFLDGQEHTAALGSGSSTLHYGLTRHMSSFTLLSEAVTADFTAPGYRRFSDSQLQIRRYTSCVFGQTAPPRRPHGGTVPPTNMIRPCFRDPFGKGSRRTPASLTPLARVLDAIVRRTLLPRLGYREGLTRM
jgi:hypothetical protein